MTPFAISTGSGGGGARLDLRASCDLATGRPGVRVGFRNEPFPLATAGSYRASFLPDGRRGFVLAPAWPLDSEGRTYLEAKARVDLPAPEFVVGGDFDGGPPMAGGMGVGVDGEVDVDVEEVSLIFCF